MKIFYKYASCILACFSMFGSAYADIHFAGTTGQDLYVRFSDAANTEVDLTEGTGDKVGLYSATDSAIESAELPTGSYMARVFDNNDELVGVVPIFEWRGDAEITKLEVWSSLDDLTSTIGFYGRGSTLYSTTVQTGIDQNSFTIADGPEVDDALNGSLAIFGPSGSGELTSVSLVYDYSASTKRVYLSDPPTSYLIATGHDVRFVAGQFTPADRGTVDSILDDTGTSGVKIEPNGVKPTTIQNDAFTAAKFASDAIDEIQDGLSTFDPISDEVTVGTNNDKTDYALSTASIASIWSAAASGMNAPGSIGARIVDNLNAVVGSLPPQSYFEALFDGAPTFAEAMSDHGYTTELAEKLERSAPTLLVSAAIVGMPTSNTEFVLAAGPDEDDALKGALVIVTRDGTTPKKAVGLVKHYNGTTKGVELVTDPEIFTFAEDDEVDVIAAGSPAALWLGGSP